MRLLYLIKKVVWERVRLLGIKLIDLEIQKTLTYTNEIRKQHANHKPLNIKNITSKSSSPPLLTLNFLKLFEDTEATITNLQERGKE